MKSMKTMRTIKNPETYIKDINDTLGYASDITVEHRSNNPKRDFLFVNKKQCKHIPCKPSDMIKMCEALAGQVNSELSTRKDYKNLKILVIGFAETATAIGTIVGDNVDKAAYILHTTREIVYDSKEVITFEETHSHATTQKLLVPRDSNFDFNDYNYILFVEDEISTGNTILNFINAFEMQHNLDAEGHKLRDIKYGVASICNWQDECMRQTFKLANIDTFALIRGSLKDVAIKMFEDEPVRLKFTTMHSEIGRIGTELYASDRVGTFFENRTGHKVDRTNTDKDIKDFIEEIYNKYRGYHSIRVIGTEEYMELPIRIAEYFEDMGHEVVCHATTRSKIDVLDSYFDGEEDGIKSRYQVPSAYDYCRETYIYNMKEYYDLVMLVTDSEELDCVQLLQEKLLEICNGKTQFIAVVKL